MCGLSGLFNYTVDDAATRVGAMNHLIAHRGPDGFGIFHEDEIALGHRRLAIVDLSAAGHQPMHYRDRYVISYNGEVYNYLELRNELSELGHVFASHTDTEVVLAAFAQWGSECLNRFNGMWAFLLYDRQEKTLFAARDRFGVKPLYYWISPSGFLAFASEIKQFTVLPGWVPRLNHQRAYDFLNWSLTDHCDETLFADVFQLRGGQMLLLKPTESHVTGVRLNAIDWYRLPDDRSVTGYEAAVRSVHDTLDDAVRLRLRADVPVGTCLSGGIDSSAIACLMNAQLRERGAVDQQSCFSACAHEKRFDERPHIQTVIDHTGSAAHYVYPSLDGLFSRLDALVWHQDEPFGSTSIFAQWEVFALAAKNGVKVILDGQGADEQLAGYPQFWGALFAGLVRRGAWLRAWREFRAARQCSSLSLAAAFKQIVNALAPAILRNFLRKIFGRVALSPSWIDASVLKATARDPFTNESSGLPSDVNPLCRSQLQSTNLQMLLHWEDRDSMAHSIEARVPFLDYRLVELLIRLPGEYKIGNGYTKRLLRDAMTSVIPSSIRLRTDKMGFETPEEVWVKNNPKLFRCALERAIGESSGILSEDALRVFDEIVDGRRRFSFLPWRMICFGTWMRVYKVQV